MKIVSVNIEIDRHHDTVNALISEERPDCICFQELLEEDFEYFKKIYNFDGVFIPTIYVQSKPHGGPQNRRYGLGIFARDIARSGYEYYVGSKEHVDQSFEEYFKENPIIEDKAFLWADILVGGIVYKVVTTHFTITEEGVANPYQLEVLGHMLERLDKLGEFILVGDMNAPRGRETWNRLALRYTDNIPLEYTTSIDQNLHRVKGIMYMIDALFTTPSYRASNVKLVDGVSDHMAVVGEVYKDEK